MASINKGEVAGLTWAGTIFVKSIANMQVSWWDCHVFMTEMVQQANCGPVPWPGTPAWCEIPGADPRKLLALAGFGVYQAVSVDAWQEASAETSSAVSGAADWAQVARSKLLRHNAIRGGGYVPRKAS